MKSALTFALVLCFGGLSCFARAEPPVRLHEALDVGTTYRVTSRVELSGALLLPVELPKGSPLESSRPKAPTQSLSVSAESAVEYDERVLERADSGEITRTLRAYQRLEFQRQVTEQGRQAEPPRKNALRPEVRRLVLLRLKQAEVPFSPDGPLTWDEIDMVRTDVFTPALRGLLKAGEVRIGDEWQAADQAVLELTDLEEIKSGKVTCKLQEIVVRNGRRLARVGLAGTVNGVNEDGPNRQQLDGYFFFDLESNHLSYLSLQGTSWLIDKDGKTTGKIEGKYVLTRRPEANNAALSDEALRTLVVQPNDDNTLLLFDEQEFGVRFVYPRRWRVQRADARQITLQEPQGGGLQLTLEPAGRTPTARQLQAEVADWMRKEQLRLVRSTSPRSLQAGTERIDQFDLEVEQGKEAWKLDYYLVRQAAGGVAAAGRYPLANAAAMQKDAERIVRSIRLVPPKKAP